MRDKEGKQLLPVWRINVGGWRYIVAARTRAEALKTLGYGDSVASMLIRFKGVFATGKPREL